MKGLVRVLAAADVPAAMRIKESAGWNQTEADWLNLLRLAPETCFGLECDGRLVATATAVCYGSALAWIGMVLTDPEYRRMGFARTLMEHTLAALDARGVEWIRLDATEMGSPLYRKLGFEEESAIERWLRPAGHFPGAGRACALGSLPAQLDRAAFGADRSELLAVLSALGFAVVADVGYAMSRPGSLAAYFGPCVSRNEGAAAELLVWCLQRHARDPVYWDLLPSNTEAVRLARGFGFAPVRRLVRMARRGVAGAPPLAHDDSLVFGVAGFEYG